MESLPEEIKLHIVKSLDIKSFKELACVNQQLLNLTKKVNLNEIEGAKSSSVMLRDTSRLPIFWLLLLLFLSAFILMVGITFSGLLQMQVTVPFIVAFFGGFILSLCFPPATQFQFSRGKFIIHYFCLRKSTSFSLDLLLLPSLIELRTPDDINYFLTIQLSTGYSLYDIFLDKSPEEIDEISTSICNVLRESFPQMNVPSSLPRISMDPTQAPVPV